MKSNRLYFIDAVKAFAILMMLQGHFIDTLLAPVYKTDTYTAYTIWNYFRGITAPTFFTISGLIFSYLLLKSKEKQQSNQRLKKGLIRGTMLIGIGYLLRLNYFDVINGNLKPYYLIVDVLQCIGLSILITVIMYQLVFKNLFLFSALMLLLANLIFVLEPLYRQLSFNTMPLAFANYFTKQNGSIFTIIPWFGYVAYGSFIATVFYKFLNSNKFKVLAITIFISLGALLLFYSSSILMRIYNFTDIIIFKQAAYYNYLYTRLGNVLIILGLFYSFEKYYKSSVFLKIGQKTLSIYVIHFIVIYGSFTGFGLHQIIGRTLTPLLALLGAIVFLIAVCLIAFYYGKTNTFIYVLSRRIIGVVKRN